MEDIEAMFTDLLGEMDLLTQSLGEETAPPESPPSSQKEVNFSFGFSDLNESLNELEDYDLDALMADLAADVNMTEEKPTTEKSASFQPQPSFTCPPPPPQHHISPAENRHHDITSASVPTPTAMAQHPPPPQPSKPAVSEDAEAQSKADKIKLALEKLKEAKVKKLVIKVVMNDGSSKTLMVDERQTVREVLDNLFEKTHCDCGVDWCLYETNPELQIERGFEDHECLVDVLSAWTRDSQNKILFLERKDKYAVFKNPQNFYLWKKDKNFVNEMKERDKEYLLTENFCGGSIIVPDVEGALYLKEDGKKSWKRRYFLLRASGIYYVPKGKTKTSSDLACFLQFDNVHVYYCTDYKNKYRAPTEFCFILKHPQIQKESQYIRYLCCDDERTMNLWVTSIRIAKYGETLHENYKAATRKACGNSAWTNRTVSTPPAPSTTPTAKAANGHSPQAFLQPKPVPSLISETKDHGGDQSIPSTLPPPPAADRFLPPPPAADRFLPPPPAADRFLPPPPAADSFLPPPVSAANAAPPPQKVLPATPQHQPAALPPENPEDFPPPPPDFFLEPPPDFLPPPPPIHRPTSSMGRDAPPPKPPPPGSSANPVTARKRIPPVPPKRTTPVTTESSGGNIM